MSRLRPPSSWIPPDSPAALLFHRGLIGGGAVRLGFTPGRAARLLRGALARTAVRRHDEDELAWLRRIASRRAEVPFEMAAADTAFAIVPAGDPASEPDAERSSEDEPGGWAGEPAGDAARDAARLGQSWEICRWTSSSPIWGELMLRTVRATRPRSCLELGTGLGLSSLYTAAALELNRAGTLVTVDNHEASRIAERGFSALGLEHRARLRFGGIDDVLGDILGEIEPVDYAFLDAEHTEAATVSAFDGLAAHLAPGAVVVLDDIMQGPGMRRAWATIASRPRVALALNLRRVGIIVVESR